MPLAPRDQALLVLLDRTPLTAALVVRASVTFGGEPFRDERRARERLQTLKRARLINDYPLAVVGGGLANYYKLTPEGYRVVRGSEAALPHRSYFGELAPSRLAHTLDLAEAIVHTQVTAHSHRIRVNQFHRENELLLEVGTHRVAPDCHWQLSAVGRVFNVLVELDRGTESLDGHAATSLRTKLLAYEAYQDHVLRLWQQGNCRGDRPAFRVVFLTRSAERALHILALARECARNPDRRLGYAATLDGFLAETDALRQPICLDHHGRWQALVNPYPSAVYQRAPVRIAPFVQPALL